jgi:IS5 family transposase
MRYFQHELPCDPSSLTRWRTRIGEEGCEWLLAQSIAAAGKAGLLKRTSLATVIIDTTVQDKAIAHPTDSRLLNRAREQLVQAAQADNVDLRQSYVRVGKMAELQAGHYAHAKQVRRMRGQVRKLRTLLGRVIRDVQRKTGELSEALKAKLEVAKRLHAQRRDSKRKLYALHAPEVECIAKGEARTPYELGVKVSLFTRQLRVE